MTDAMIAWEGNYLLAKQSGVFSRVEILVLSIRTHGLKTLGVEGTDILIISSFDFPR